MYDFESLSLNTRQGSWDVHFTMLARPNEMEREYSPSIYIKLLSYNVMWFYFYSYFLMQQSCFCKRWRSLIELIHMNWVLLWSTCIYDKKNYGGLSKVCVPKSSTNLKQHLYTFLKLSRSDASALSKSKRKVANHVWY